MTQTEKSSRKVISGAGWVNPLTHDYRVDLAADVHVFADAVELVSGVDYTVSNVANDAGYVVTITNAGAWAPANWVLDARPAIDQGANLSLGGQFGTAFEAAIDKLTRRVQRVYDLAKRGVKAPISTALGVSYDLPAPAANYIIGWSADGTELENKINSSNVMAAPNLRNMLDVEVYVANRAALKLLDTSNDIVALLDGANWYWSSSNLSTLVAADPREAYYVAPASAPTGASGAWVKRREDLDVNIRDFGAVQDGVTDDQPASQAALNFIKTQGGGVLRVPPSASVTKLAAGLVYDLSAVATRFGQRLTIKGDGPNSCFSMVGVATALLAITGSASFPEMHAHFEGIRLIGNNTVGSKGLALSISAFGTSDGLIIEGFDYCLDCTDVEQTAFLNSNFRWGIHGVRFNAAVSTTSANSLLFVNCAIANNSKWGAWFTNPNAVKFEGGSVQYNGTLGGGATEWGIKITEAGNGYGTVLFHGVAIESNGGDADVISEQTTYVAAYIFAGCGFTRSNNTNYATNFLKIDGTAAATYQLTGNTWRGYGTYVASAGRPYIAVNNTSAKVVDDGTNVYGSATEQPAWAGSAQFSTSLVPQTNDGGAIGAATKSWSDVFLASGAVLNFANGNYTVTHSTGTLTFSGGSSWGGALLPATDDGAALGSTTKEWSDLFVASGAVLNFANGNYTVTHSTGTLTFSGGASWGGALLPAADGTPSLGSASFRWANTYIAAGGQIIFGTADASITHANGSRIAIGGNLSRQSPVTKTANFSVGVLENWLIVNQAATTTVTLPSAASYPGREIMIRTIQAQLVNSASSNVVPLVGGAAGTAILAAAAGKWATLVSDGTNWQIMAGN